MKGRQIAYSELELAFVKVRATWPRRDLHAEFQRVFDRPEISQANLSSLCKRNGWLTGRTGHYEKGRAPENKGKKRPFNAASAAHQFKPGHRSGRAEALYQPIGTEKMRDGYLVRKVNDDMPLQRRWRAVHLIRWEEINGPIPPGHALKCLDGDRTNTDPANWQLVHRGVLPRLTGRWSGIGFEEAEPEIRPVLIATAELAHKASTLRKRGRA